MNKIWFAVILGLVIGGSRLGAQGPELLSIGAEEAAGGSGRLSSIAVDSQNQPHIVSDGGTYAYFYDKIGGSWSASSLNVGSLGYKQYYNPHIEIDSANRAWVSGILVSGLGLIVRENMNTAPSGPFFSDQRIQGAWDSGNLSIDPGAPLDCVLMSARGRWKKVTYAAASPNRVADGGSGTLYAGADGEKKGFWISKAGNVAHADGTRGVWHLAIGGYSAGEPNQYQNSVRNAAGQPRVTWAAYSPYSTMEDDGTYVDCVSDAINPLVAYMATDFSCGGKFSGTAGIAMNIWNGSALVFPPTAILSLDPAGTCGLRRFSPQLTPAKSGGVFITWIRAGRVKLRYVSAAGVPGTEYDISVGNWSAICTDSQGNLHIVYNNGGIKYRKLVVSGGEQWVTLPGDYNGDGRDDLSILDPNLFKWYIKDSITGAVLVWALNWGSSGMQPAPGDYDGDGVSDVGAYGPSTGMWYIRSLAKNLNLAWDFQWGYSGAVSVPGDYDGDGSDDLAVYSGAASSWHVFSLKRNMALGVELNWGFAESRVVPGDYNGDGRNDLAVFDPTTKNWYIKELDLILADKTAWGWPTATSLTGDYNGDGKSDLVCYDSQTGNWYIRTLKGTVLCFPRQWGFKGAIPVKGDYNGDGINDLAVYDPATGNWYILGMNSQVLAWGVNFGYSGAMPVPGDYDGDGADDLAVYDSTKGLWYIRKLNGSVLAFPSVWGFAPTKAIPGDYNGDGISDLAVYDPATGKWYIRKLSGEAIAMGLQWGFAGGVPLSGDFTGDGADDLVIYHPPTGKWYIYSVAGQSIVVSDYTYGNAGMTPMADDVNGDGRADLILCDAPNGQWNIKHWGAVLKWGFQWGMPGAWPVAGDYDGDGANDLAIYDPAEGRWWVYSSAKSKTLISGFQYGASTMIPVSGDYDGDGISDIAVWNKPDGLWYVWTPKTSGNLTWGNQWGFSGAIPLGSLSK